MTTVTHKLSRDAYERARGFLLEHARPLDRALFRLSFDGGAANDVFAALRAYRNADAGFGRAIEPDFRLEASSPMGTNVALRHLRTAGAGTDSELVRGAVRYLLETYQSDRHGWLDVPPQVNDAPHAPWWHWSDDRGFGPHGAWANPNAQILGALHAYAPLVPDTLLRELDEIAQKQLDGSPPPLRDYSALCFQDLAMTAPAPLRSRIVKRLRADARSAVDLDPEKWSENHFHPHWLARTPDDPVADLLEPELGLSLDRLITHQDEDGAWTPQWSWESQYPDAWRLAREEWRGEQTARFLATLRAFGRIEGA